MDFEKVTTDDLSFFKKLIGDYYLYVYVGKSELHSYYSFPSIGTLPLNKYLVVGMDITDKNKNVLDNNKASVFGIDNNFDWVGSAGNLLKYQVTFNQLKNIYDNMVALVKMAEEKNKLELNIKPFYMMASYSSTSSEPGSVQYFEKLETAQKALKEKKKELTWRTGLEEHSDMHFKFITGWEEVAVTWKITEKRMIIN
jgi:hypothetical protein